VRPENPDLRDVVTDWIERYLEQVHTATIGRVQSYDATTQTADVVPVIRQPLPQPDGALAYEDAPVLPSIPVVQPRTAGWFLALPVAAGDYVLVVTLEQSPGGWLAGDGGAQDAGDPRRHHLANAVAIPGVFPHNQRLAHAHAQHLVLGSDASDGPRLTLKPGGEIQLTQGGITVLRVEPNGTVHLADQTAANFVALANLVNARLSAIQQKFDAHKHKYIPGTSGTADTDAVLPPDAIGTLASVAAEKTKAK
jgi:hypothetical protein